MRKTNKGLFGFLVFGPMVLILVAIIGAVVVSFQIDGHAVSHSDAELIFVLFLGLVIAALILSFVSMFFYVIHAARSQHLSEGARLGWIIGFIIANGITQMVYFFFYVVKETELEKDRIARKKHQREIFGESGSK